MSFDSKEIIADDYSERRQSLSRQVQGSINFNKGPRRRQSCERRPSVSHNSSQNVKDEDSTQDYWRSKRSNISSLQEQPVPQQDVMPAKIDLIGLNQATIFEKEQKTYIPLSSYAKNKAAEQLLKSTSRTNSRRKSVSVERNFNGHKSPHNSAQRCMNRHFDSLEFDS